ncbi:hypothetical protein ABZ776_14200, partial [Streptomyces sp. NPDC007076]|uniref:hypothetical protein n=1 Tax=Streptomyces sp. NPDC007076 TaxID=3160975 RepID=UPI0033C670B5
QVVEAALVVEDLTRGGAGAFAPVSRTTHLSTSTRQALLTRSQKEKGPPSAVQKVAEPVLRSQVTGS